MAVIIRCVAIAEAEVDGSAVHLLTVFVRHLAHFHNESGLLIECLPRSEGWVKRLKL